jgi:hypothetical protein
MRNWLDATCWVCMMSLVLSMGPVAADQWSWIAAILISTANFTVNMVQIVSKAK